jgi:DNA-binding beta-propeller fold protein YncE
MTPFRRFAAVVAVSLCSSAADAQTLFAVSVRTFTDPSYKGLEGSLYRVDPASGVTILVAPLRLDGRDSIGLDGLAIHPKTGEVFGVTSPTVGIIPHSLVRVDSATGSVSLIGDLGASGSDVSFDPDGTLFMWLPKTSQIGRVDTKAATITAVGTPRPATAKEGGISAGSGGVALVAASGGLGTLDSIDLKTGAVIASVQMKGASYAELMAGLAVAPDGTLYGVNTNGGTPALAELVKIDRKTGLVTPIGQLPHDTNSIAFGPAVEAEKTWDLDQWRVLLLPIFFVIAAGLVAFFAFGKRRSR